MKKIFIPILIFLTQVLVSADSMAVQNKIEKKSGLFGIGDYYYGSMKLNSNQDYYNIFKQSSNPNVLMNYRKFTGLQNTNLILSFCIFAVMSLYTFSPPVSTQRNIHYDWTLPTISVLIVSAEIPISFLKHKYFENAIKQYNESKKF
jgi:hypothetical protein